MQECLGLSGSQQFEYNVVTTYRSHGQNYKNKSTKFKESCS